jgi:hypothetical protein
LTAVPAVLKSWPSSSPRPPTPTRAPAAGSRRSVSRNNELDGVEADVLYTTLGFRLFWLKDAGLQHECE